LAALLAALLLLFAALPRPIPRTTATELRGVWVTNVASGVLFVPWGVERALRQLAQLNFSTVYPVVWNRGRTFYPSAIAKRTTGQLQEPLLFLTHPGQDLLAQIVRQGHRHGLKIIPWFEYGLMAPAGSELAVQHPDWLTQRRDGSTLLQDGALQLEENDRARSQQSSSWHPPNWHPPNWQQARQSIGKHLVAKQVWLNPFHPDVQQFLIDTILEVVTRYDVDGIQLDDHFSLPVAFGYDPVTLNLYQQEHQGRTPPDDARNPEWMRWRADKLTELMQKIFRAVKAAKPDILVSLSPNAQSFAYREYLQDWSTWVQNGWVEELVLQVYRDDLNSFIEQLEQPAVQRARQRIPVGVGILTGIVRRPIPIKQIQQQVQVVRDRGFSGVSFFYWESLWSYLTPESPQRRRRGFQMLFGQKAGNRRQGAEGRGQKAGDRRQGAEGKTLIERTDWIFIFS